MFDLHNKVALVTGARRGMGKAHAIALAGQGATVAVTDINKEECEAVVAEIAKNGGKAAAYKLDVSSAAEVTQVFAKVVRDFGKLDILVNNAGIYFSKPALEMTEEEWDKMLAVNLKGQFLCAQAAAREMQKWKWGRIINVSSIASGQVGVGMADSSHYTASKGGVIGMSETLAVEWAELGITVNVIAPGAIDTQMVAASEMPKAELDAMLAGIPLKRIGKPEEVAALAVFLASEESSYVTGATFYVDGGWLAA